MLFSVCSVCMYFQRQARKDIPKYIKLRKRDFNTALPGLFQEINTNLDHDHSTAWIEPKGYESGISIYNSLSKSKVPLTTLNPGLVNWYNCGPTVYDSAHIGHALCFVKLDIIRRILEDIFQLSVVQVTGVTDIDEKIINKAKQLNVSPHILTEKYEKEFFEDMRKMNVRPPSMVPRVSHYIPHIQSFIERIIDKGFAYVVEGSVYFDLAAYGRDSKFVRHNDNAMPMTRIAPDPRKKNLHDFALWRGARDCEIVWDSPWGPGIPGWHIECSAMASHIFGGKLDLHSGGIDLMFPHHENEECQCCAYHDCDQWCNYWIHTGHLHVHGEEKMSKSLQNTISVDQFLQDYSSNIFRIFCLTSNYRTYFEYSSETMERARQHLNKLISFLQDSEAYIRGSTCSGDLDAPLILENFSEVKRNIRSSLADDFNTKQAMVFLMEFISVCNMELHKKQAVRVGRSASTVAAVRGYVQQLLTSLGMKFDRQLLLEDETVLEENYLTNVLDSTLRFRQTVRNFALLKNNQNSSLSKNEMKKMKQERDPLLKACDRMRDEIGRAGIRVKDHSAVASWSIHKGKSDIVEDEERE